METKPVHITNGQVQSLISSGVLNTPKLTNWANEPTYADLTYDISQARQPHMNQVSKIETWLKSLHAETDRRKIKKGRSGVTPKVIRRLAEWRYGTLSSSLLNERKLFSVNAFTPDQQEAAIQNELMLNFQFNALLNKVKFINDLVRACVNEGTAIVRVGWETEQQVREKKVPIYLYAQPTPANALMLSQLMSTISDETEQYGLDNSSKTPTFQNLHPDMQESVKASHKHNQYVTAINTKKMQTIKETIQTKNRPAIKVIPNSSLIIDPSCEGDFEQARFAVYVFTTSYSELKTAGIYKNLDKIFQNFDGKSQFFSENILGMPDATFIKSMNDEISSFQFKDKARQRLVAYEYWGYWDTDNTGIVQPIVATIVGNTIIRLERSPFPDGRLPFVVIPYMPVKGSVYGEPDGELIKDNQEIIQALTRAMVDIQARSANGQTAIPKGYLDALNSKKFREGEDYEYNPNDTMHPAEAVFMHTTGEIPQSVLALLQQQYAEAEASTGVKSFQGGIDADAYGQTVQGMSQAVTALTQRENDILFRIGKGLEQIGNKIVAMNQVWLGEEEFISLTQSEFVPIRREEIQGEFFLNVSIKSNSEAEGKAQQLTFVAQTLGSDVDWEIRKIFLLEICKLYNLDTMLTAIKNYEPKPDEVAQQAQQMQLQELQSKIAKLQSEAEYFKSRSDFIEAQVDDVQAATDQKSLDYLEQQSGIKHARQKEIVEAQAKAQNDGKIATELLKGQHNLHKANMDNNAKQDIAYANALSKANNANNKSPIKLSIDPSTGRAILNGGNPRRSLFKYKTGNIGSSEPNV